MTAVSPAALRAQDDALETLPGQTTVEMLDSGNIELHVSDMPLRTVLRMLSVQGKRNIVATPAVHGSATADLYNVPFETALDAILSANDCAYRIRDGFIYVYTRKELAERAVAAREDSTLPIACKIFTLNYITAADAEPIVIPLLSQDGSVAKSPASVVGIASDPTNAGGNALAGSDFLAVYDYPDRLEAVARVIRQIDVRPRQVLVEATILRAQLNDDNALGIDFTLLGGVDLELLGATSLGLGSVTLGSLPTDRLERFNSNVTTDFASNVPSGGLHIGILKDHVAVFIRALEEITDISVLANPKILALNKQPANIIVGRRDGYITTTVTQTQAIQKVDFLETGTQLSFRPFIGTDGFVRMELHPEDSTGGLTSAQLPFEQTTEITTNVIVPDGHTILIGGLFRETTQDIRAQVPLLGDLPLVGDLFRSRSDSLDREEVIILLTVHIIKDYDAYSEESEGQLQGIERSRVAHRRAMMWHSRERLAQAHYRRAVDRFADGDEAKALWHARMANHHNPRFPSAIRLEEQIEHRREWEADSSMTRSFISTLIRREKGQHGNRFSRPEPVSAPNGQQRYMERLVPADDQ